MRALAPIKFADGIRPAQEVGRRAELVMLPIERLVVDDRYQRPITAAGKKNILQIVEHFDWKKFAPLIVTRVDNGKYAIIDGQHRATAAMMHPAIDMVPCMVIEAGDIATAASCFAAINSKVTPVTTVQTWYARLRSGETWALHVQQILEEADVIILRTPSPKGYGRGETFAIAAIESALRNYNTAVVRLALQAITGTGGGNVGMLRAAVIKAMCAVVKGPPSYLGRQPELFSAMEEIDLAALLATAGIVALEARENQTSVLTGMLKKRIAELIPVRVPEAAE